jgi:hypothetical protein
MSDSVTEAGVPAEPAEPTAAEPDAPPASGSGPDSASRPEDDPSAPAPLNVPRTPTGNADVDAVLDRLADADHLATDGHIEVYEDVHGGLRDALTALDARPGPPVPTPARHPTTTPQRGPSGHTSHPYGNRS